jgi:hypothetical protein
VDAELAAVVAERDAALAEVDRLRSQLAEVADVAEERGYDVQEQRDRADRAEATLTKVAEAASGWEGEAERYERYEHGSSLAGQHRAVARSLRVNVGALRAILDADPAPKTERHPDVDYRALSENAPRRDVPQADSKLERGHNHITRVAYRGGDHEGETSVQIARADHEARAVLATVSLDRIRAQAKAEALREAADFLDEASRLNPSGNPMYISSMGLRQRADQIEEAKT